MTVMSARLGRSHETRLYRDENSSQVSIELSSDLSALTVFQMSCMDIGLNVAMQTDSKSLTFENDSWVGNLRLNSSKKISDNDSGTMLSDDDFS